MNWRDLDTEARRALIKERQHMSTFAVAKDLGVNKETVRVFCLDHGIKLVDGRRRHPADEPIGFNDQAVSIWEMDEASRRQAIIRRAAKGARKGEDERMRESLSKKLRFDVFKRDGFVCVYCGAHPPDALLEVDHIHPVAEGGANDIDNLVTACFECNRGKGAGLLTTVPQSLADKAEETAEREAQLRAYYAILQASKDRKDDELWSIADIYMERWGDDKILRAHLASIRSFLDQLDFFEVQDAMELATRKTYSKGPCFRYFAGICWRKIKRANGEEV